MLKKLSNHPITAVLGMILGLGLCVGLFLYLDLSSLDFRHMFTHSRWPSIVLIPISLTILLMLTGAWKWSLLTEVLTEGKGQAKEQGYLFFLRHYLWQNWLGLFVPPSIAIIAGRGVAHRHDTGFKSGALNGFIDQALEFSFIAALIPIGLLYLLGEIGVIELVLISLFFQIIVGALLWRLSLLWRPSLKVMTVLPILFLSIVRVNLTLIRLAVGAATLGLTIAFWKIVASAPAVSLLALIPMTPGNLGIAEWGWTGILVWAGSNPVDAGLLAIGFRLLVMAIQTILLGGYEAYVLCTKKQ